MRSLKGRWSNDNFCILLLPTTLFVISNNFFLANLRSGLHFCKLLLWIIFFFQFWKLWFQSPFLQIVLMDNFLATCRCGSSVCKLCKLSFETNFFCANFANCSEGLFPPTFCTFPFWITFLRLVVIRKRWSGSRWFNWAGGSRWCRCSKWSRCSR